MGARGRAFLAGGALVLALHGRRDAHRPRHRGGRQVPAGFGRGERGDPGKGSITVRCAGRGLYYTTYHLNFVVVPATVSVRKEAGAPVLLMLEKRGGGIALTEIR